MRRGLLLIAAAFAAGVGVGYLVRPAPIVGRAAQPGSATPGLPADGTAAPSGLHEQIMALPAPEAPAGDGRITGHVQDETGAALEGALVMALVVMDGQEHKTRKGAAAPEDRDLEDLVREVVWQERGRRDSRRTARTGPDGAYEVTGVAQAKWQLRAYKEGYVFQPARGSRSYNVEPGATVDFVGEAIVRIDVEVRMPDGSPPPNAQIRAEWQSGHSSTTAFERWLPGEPWIELKPQAYELIAEVRGVEYLKSQPQSVKVEPGSPRSLVFQLESRPALRVRVTHPDGLRVPEASVWAMRFLGEKAPDPVRLRGEGLGSYSASADKSVVTWQDIQPGSYLVGAAYSSNLPVVTSQVVQVGRGMTEVDLSFPSAGPGEFLVVRVGDADGAIPRDVRFLLGSAPGSAGTATALERTDGAFLLPRGEDQTGGEAPVYVTAESRSLGRIERACGPTDTGEIVFAFKEPAFVKVVIPGYVESPQAGWVTLSLLERERTKPFGYRREKVQPDGGCRLGPEQPGRFDILVHSLVDVNTAWLAATIPVDLRSGEQTVTINMPELYTLRIRWPGSGPERSLMLQSKEPFASWVTRKVTEEVTTIDRVPAGRYELRPFGAGDAPGIEVNVPEQTEITIK